MKECQPPATEDRIHSSTLLHRPQRHDSERPFSFLSREAVTAASPALTAHTPRHWATSHCTDTAQLRVRLPHASHAWQIHDWNLLPDLRGRRGATTARGQSASVRIEEET